MCVTKTQTFTGRQLDEVLLPSCPVTSVYCLVLVMAALCNRAGHYIFALWFLSSIFYLSIFLFFLA